MAKKQHSNDNIAKRPTQRKYLAQTDVPSYSLEQALRIPRAIVENYGRNPVTPLQLASALNVTPNSGSFRQLCGASIAYGLTDGGSFAQQISLTNLGKRIFKPLEEGDDLSAKREAFLKPQVIRQFLNRYNNSPFPREDIAKNVLEEMGIPRDKTKAVSTLIGDCAQSLGLLREIKGKQYIDLTGVKESATEAENAETTTSSEKHPENGFDQLDGNAQNGQTFLNTKPNALIGAKRRVFITHGKNKDFIEPIKKLLGFGELIPVVSVEKQSVSKPVPDKVMDDMRSCGAAIIHVEEEMKLVDQEAQVHAIINPNVLIEIGAAMALFGRRFILLVKQGVTLPSNLQGLYEVRYTGENLDGEVTIKLLEAIKDMKSQSLPNRDVEDK